MANSIKKAECYKEDEKASKARVVKGEECQENMEWLSRSIVGEALNPIDVDVLAKRIHKD